MTARPRPTDDPERRASRRLVEALEEVRFAAKALGLDPEAIAELNAPLGLRVDAWCHRIERERDAWARILASPLFTTARPRRRAAA